MAFDSPLRYPGGKAQLGPWLASLIEYNGLNRLYVEPYGGGCGAALYLLANQHVTTIAINDFDPAVHAFWWAVLNDTTRLVDRILSVNITVQERERQRAILASATSKRRDVAFAAFFLNRTNRSGILSAGVIGGLQQDGPYKIDARFNREELAQRILKIRAMRDCISLTGDDALLLLNNLNRKNGSKRSLVYLDPPYYVKGAQLYRNFYDHSDHAQIASKVLSLKRPWLVTYDNCSAIRNLYKKAERIKYSPYYSTHTKRNRVSELMFFGHMKIPERPYLARSSTLACST